MSCDDGCCAPTVVSLTTPSSGEVDSVFGTGVIAASPNTGDVEVSLSPGNAGEILRTNQAGVAEWQNYVESGTYNPTISSSTNTDSIAVHSAVYMRVGNIVTVSGNLSADPTDGTATIDARWNAPIPVSGTSSGSLPRGTIAGAQGNVMGAGSCGVIGNGNLIRARLLPAGAGSVTYGWQLTYEADV